MTEARLVSLITSHLSADGLDADDLLELQEWASQSVDNRLLLERVSDETQLAKEIELWKRIDPARGYAIWLADQRSRRRARIYRIGALSAAASIFIAIGIGSLLQHRQLSSRPTTAPTSLSTKSVSPGRNTALLTLASGKQILLDSAGMGELAQEGGVRLIKTDSSHVSYRDIASAKEEPQAFNLLTTPKAGQYQLTLPDGSRVWLNNVSSIRYPTTFHGKDRTVQLTGEAYFEIAPRPDQPFIVEVQGQKVEVLGTSFNVMGYPEEGRTQTTLVTGAVRVSAGKGVVALKPNEQANVDAAGSLTVIKGVPSNEIISWKDGFFYFGHASFGEMMRQLARWYDIELIYEGGVPKMEFGGKIDRALPLEDVLQYLNESKVHFRLEGRKLIILPS